MIEKKTFYVFFSIEFHFFNNFHFSFFPNKKNSQMYHKLVTVRLQFDLKANVIPSIIKSRPKWIMSTDTTTKWKR